MCAAQHSRRTSSRMGGRGNQSDMQASWTGWLWIDPWRLTNSNGKGCSNKPPVNMFSHSTFLVAICSMGSIAHCAAAREAVFVGALACCWSDQSKLKMPLIAEEGTQPHFGGQCLVEHRSDWRALAHEAHAKQPTM